MEISKRLKSKTYWLAIATAGLGIVEVNMHLMQEMLGQYYGAAFIVVALLAMAVREMTTGPVTGK